MSELALQLIAENKRTQDPFLDLGNCGLTELPDELFDCIWLEKLNLGRRYYDANEKKWFESPSSKRILNIFKGNELIKLNIFSNLKYLYLSSCQIIDIKFLENLYFLRFLDLCDNQITNIEFLEKLTNLQFLELSQNQISKISALKNLIHLKELDLSNNKITNDDFISTIPILEKLLELQTLSLSSNQISYISLPLKLTKLQNLNISDNKIWNISFLEVDKLSNLQNLNISKNGITNIRFLAKLTNLQYLDISHNQISDIHFLTKLTELRYLNVRHNIISNIHFNDTSLLGKLQKLKVIDLSYNLISDLNLGKLAFIEDFNTINTVNLSNNKLSDIKPLLPLLKKNIKVSLEKDYIYQLSHEISLKDNPISNPPLEVVKRGNEAILEYFEGKRKCLNECKLIFVGDGSVGKTSLMRRIVYNKFDINEETTHGINKIAWEEIKSNKNETVKVNLWDFGGQHIQHSLHQFFFTERVIYVLVLNPRNDQKANYWLDQIEKLGCNSEILIVYNWKQEADKEADYLSNFYELRKRYPKLTDPFLLSCKTSEGIKIFKTSLISSILRNEGLKVEYLVPWFNIKQRLEKEVSIGKNYINYDTYQQWCLEEEYNEPDRQKSLLKILDSIGSIVFFDKPILNQLQVLNPEWLTTGAYAILVSKLTKENKGHLKWSDFQEIFKEEKSIFSDKEIKIKYDEGQFQFIIELMLQYDLCQRNIFGNNEFLIPSAFGEKSKDYEKEKINARNYRLQFDSPFEMLIIHRFIAKNLLKITGKDYWQSGIYIKHPDSETFALVETNLYSERIDCWIKGENIRGFWEIIRADFREILSIYKASIKEEVLYQKDGREVFLPYNEMLNSLRNGVSVISYHPTYELSNIDVLAILDLFEDKTQTQKNMENGQNYNQNTNTNNANPIINIFPPSTPLTEPKPIESDADKKLKAYEKAEENRAVKKWEQNAIILFFISLIITLLGFYVYINEIGNFDWEKLKKGEYFKWLGLAVVALWNGFTLKMLYDRFLDDTKEKGFKENLKNKSKL